ncbi:extracellular solute-binding protein [Paenibacillus sonchi]|uniref:extracellular solute-binding protein n=1 Tax=Paenibacillus sonchi TaxID=373687 RepID=UPI001E3838D2|nr:extracellular solute-binding protein [Paenibacillus sonchi]MCE3200860.1 extracellular solute-binding protein [Paenibacillus sonchi]
MNNKSGRQSFRERLEYMVSKLRTDILSGILQPGAYLPAESTLAKQFELSNKSVRRGLDVLVQEGLIVKIDRVGSMVMESVKERIRIHFGCSSSLTKDFKLDDLIAEFHRLHPGIHVLPLALNNFDHVNSAMELINNGMLDVLSLNSTQFQELAENGSAGLLETLEPDPGLYPIASEAFLHNGALFAYPISFSPVVLCYNKAHFREADLPEPDSYWTWDDLIEAARKLSEKRGRHAVYFVPASENRYSVFLLQSGIRTMEDGEHHQTLSPETANSLNVYSRLVNNHQIFPKYLAGNHDDETVSLFVQEQVSMILTTYYNLNDFKDLSLDYDLAPLPTLKAKDPQKTLLVTIGAAVVENSRQKEAARQFVSFLASPEAQRMIRERSVSIPARKRIAEMAVDDHLNRPSRYLMYRELFPTFSYLRDLGLPIAVLQSFRKLLNAYWSRMIDETTLYEEMGRLIAEENKGKAGGAAKALI